MLSTQINKETLASSRVKYGSFASGAAAAQIAANYFKFNAGVIIFAPSANTASIFLGDSAVTVGTGFPLPPGANIELPIEELQDIYAISAAAQNLNWIGF